MVPFALVCLLAAASPGATRPPATDAPLGDAMAAAESALREGERAVAESRFRSALLEAWLLRGGLDAADGRWPEAKEAFTQAGTVAVETRRAFESLALVHLQLGETREAVALLSRVAGSRPRDVRARRLLAQALIADGKPEQGLQELDEARVHAPDDLELTFALATGHLRLKRLEQADRLFAEVAKKRPIAATHVLIGRMYRDYRQFDRAAASLRKALALDPKARRAHFYLGTVAAMAEESAGLADALREFEAERALAPDDPLVNRYLGIALVEARRYEEALPRLELAARAAPSTDIFYYAGRCHLALGRPAEGATALRRALELNVAARPDEARLRSLHYQLGTALRALGQTAEAATHFAEAERYSVQRTEADRDRLARYLADVPAEADRTPDVAALLDGSPLAERPPAERRALRQRAEAALVHAYTNLGVLKAQAERFPRAAELLEQAVRLAPDFAPAQYALGVAYFNAKRFAEARAPLTRAVEADPKDAGARRMLALAHLNAEDYAAAARLLERDPERETSAELQYSYGLALLKGGRTAEGQAVFSRLLARHGDSAEINVVLGQAHAQDGDYESAERALRRALELKKDVLEANATLGVLYLKQGRLAEAEKALRAELAANPADFKARHHLAAVLEMDGRPGEAVPLLRLALKAKPDFADARYLIGKILLAQGAALEAAEHLELAARLQPQDANIHYQLAQAYRRLGREPQAQASLAEFQKLKEKRREVKP